MVRTFVLLLLLLAGLYIGLEILRVTGQDVLIMDRFSLQRLQTTEFRAFLGIAIIICEFIVLLFALLPRVADTLRDVIKPVARLIPLGLFLLAMYKTFMPIFTAFLPTEITGAAETDPVAYLTAAASDGTLTRAILFSLGSMLLFVLANRVLGEESSRLKSLEAELAKNRRGRG